MHLPWVCMQAPCQLLFFANSPAHQRAVGPLRPFMPHIGVIDCLFVVRCFCVCTIEVHASGKSPVFFPIPGCRCYSGLTRRSRPAAQRWLLLPRAKTSCFVFAPCCSVLSPCFSVLLRLAPAKMLNYGFALSDRILIALTGLTAPTRPNQRLYRGTPAWTSVCSMNSVPDLPV